MADASTDQQPPYDRVPEVERGAGTIRARMQGLIAGYDAYDAAVKRLLAESAPQGVTVAELVDRIHEAPELGTIPGGGQAGFAWKRQITWRLIAHQ